MPASLCADLRILSKRIERELKIWCTLKHANILELLGVAFEPGHVVSMICPWMEEGNLTNYLEKHHGTLSLKAQFKLVSITNAEWINLIIA